MEITLFETCINFIQSIMIALFLRSLITKPKGKNLAFYTTGYAIIEFIFIQWMNTNHGLSGGMFEFLDILFCFIYFCFCLLGTTAIGSTSVLLFASGAVSFVFLCGPVHLPPFAAVAESKPWNDYRQTPRSWLLFQRRRVSFS